MGGQDDPCEVGFYNCIWRDERALHVQTEVLAGGPVRIMSTIMEDGAVLDSAVVACPAEGGGATVRKVASVQHERMVANVAMGKYD